MITVTIQGSPTEVRQELNELADAMGLLGMRDRAQEPEPTKKAAKEEKQPPKETVKKSSEPTDKPKAESKTDEPLTIETIKGVVPKLMVKLGREKVVALLGEFGAKKGSEVQEKDFVAFMQKANELLA